MVGQSVSAQTSPAYFGDARSVVDPTVAVSFGAATYTVAEGWTVDVMVTLDVDPQRTVTIPIEASPAAAGDYSIPGSVTFDAGETRQPINFVTVDDSVVESADETFTLSFGSTLPTGVNSGSLATAEVTVTDDDAPDPSNLELSALAATHGAETMYPVFNPRVHHYAIRCPNDASLHLTATARDASHELTLNHIPVPGMSLDKNVLVNSDHDVAIGLSSGGESVLYVVHCIPPAFPNIKITRKQAGVSDGLILFTPQRQPFPRVPAFMAIMDNNGVPRFVRDSFLATATPTNFRRHSTDLVVDGRQVQYSVTHYLGSFNGRHVLLDGSFKDIKSVETKLPEHKTNSHDFLITPDGTFLFSSRRTVSRDLGGGDVRDTFENIIEEVSPTGTTVWSWSSWDHLTIDPDCLGYDLGLGAGQGISAHINSLTLIEGDVVISSRGCAQVARINRSAKSMTVAGTDLVWQLGGTDLADTFPDDRAFLSISGDENGRNEFCRQHHATETDAGTVVLFDNGVNCLSAELAPTDSSKRHDLPTFSRVVEYDIDPASGTAVFRREFLLDRMYGYAPFTGSVDILENGNWLFTWGYLLYEDPGLSVQERSIALSEVDSSGVELLRVNAWSGSDRYVTFRAYREPEADLEIPLNLPAILIVKSEQAAETDVEMLFEVELGAAISEEVTVDYDTADGTATAWQDYTPRSGTLTFPSNNATPQTIRVPILNDDIAEADIETFVVRLHNATNAVLAGGETTLTATGTIADDDKRVDPPPQPPPPQPPPPPDPEPDPEPELGPPKASFMVDAVCEDGLCGALTGDPVSFEDTSSGRVRLRTWDFGDDSAARTRTARHAWAKPGFYEVTLRVGDGAVESTASLTFLVEAAAPAGTCVADASTRCLLDSRYSVTVDWWRADGAAGSGSVVHAGTNDSGLFLFFDPENWEVLIKVLDGCALNGNVWVYGASTTDLGYAIRITDTATGAVREYRNEPGTPAAAITDGTAFPEGCRP